MQPALGCSTVPHPMVWVGELKLVITRTGSKGRGCPGKGTRHGQDSRNGMHFTFEVAKGIRELI